MAMARNRYTKLNLGPMTEARHRSVAGSIVIADYVDPTNSQRTLVLEKVATEPKRKSSKKPKPQPEGALGAFPTGQAVSSGS
jgi:hypothetical protein